VPSYAVGLKPTEVDSIMRAMSAVKLKAFCAVH